ncbi:hypothetical protein CU098_001371, partial [Rhizopus stolonifer]
VATFDLPQQSGPWILGDEDISMKFHQYRNSCIRALSTTKFSIENHFNELLTVLGIIVALALFQAARTATLVKSEID